MAERETNARKSLRGSSSRPSVGVGRSGGSGGMSNPFSPPAWEKEHFWLYLLALGFDPAVNAAAGKLSTHLQLGVNLFDKPNKDAFHIVAWFLFSKLDQSHCNEVFRFCYPPTDKKADSEFRKQCYEWLKRISDECGNCFPSVVASLFLSPGGPKFIHLMFHFARYVIMRHIKVDSLGAGIPYPEAVNSRSPDLSMAVRKYQVALNRFSQCLQKEDLMIQELQKKALFFTKQIRDLRYGNVDLDKRLQKMGKKIDSGQSNTTERIEKVRYLWATVMETLTFLQKEREVVDSVVKGHVDQYTLDGTSVSVSIPQPLLQKVEKELYKFPIGNVYEEGKLNMLTIIQLLTKALELLLHKRRQVDKKGFKIDLQDLEGNTRFQNETLLGLKSLRQKLKCDDHISVTQSIAEKQLEWQLKWKNRLGQSPFHLIKDPNPALDLLPAMSPLSFTPATEEAYKKSVFCQYPALIPDSIKKNVQADEFVTVGKTLGNEDNSTKTVTERTLKLATHSEKTSNVETQKRTDNSQFQILENKGRNSRRIESRKERQTDSVRIPSSSAKKGDSLKKAQEQLAEEVADVVISDSPHNTGKDVGDLINALFSNPFLTRKQIPRTPENLNSIKKNVQADEFVTVGKTLGNEDNSTKTVTERTLKLATHSEKTSNVETPKRTDNSQFQILENKGRNSRRIESGKERQTDSVRIPSSSAKKGDSLKKAQEQLAEEVADVVISDSPHNTGKDVGDLINALFSNPFLTRKQIPRTPENLNSIKKNVQADEFVTVGKTLGNEDNSTKTVTERTLKLATHSEKTSNVETPKRTDNSQFQILENKGRNSRRIESGKERQTDSVGIPSSSAKKGDSLKKAQEQLAEEVADVVISDSPHNTGKDVGDLINALFSNPFLTRKQIPRTPENLITEIRSSWQKAIQTESPSGEAPHDSEATEQLSQEAVPDFRHHLNSNLTLFMSPCISDTAEFPFLDVEPSGSSQQGITDELLNQQEAFRPLDKIISKKELSLAAPDQVENLESVFQALNRNVHEVSCGSGNHTGSETLSHSVGQNSTMCATLLRQVSQAISRTGLDSHDVMQLGILQETFPEEGESISLNSLHDLDLDESGEDNSRDRKSATDYLSGNECKLDFQSISSRYEALKKTLLDHPPDPGKRMPRCRSAFNLSPTSLETKDVLSPLGKRYASDAELAKKSSQPSHLERRNSLSPLKAICPLWLREKRDMQVRGDVFNKRKEK